MEAIVGVLPAMLALDEEACALDEQLFHTIASVEGESGERQVQ